jgi:predicted enzyme related to lactoylglutathione lyase
MTSRIRHITVDCADPYELAGFWSAATGYPRHPDDRPDDPAALLMALDGEGPGLLFVAVPEPKSVKNRLHFDLQPIDCSREEEVERLVGLGATVVADHRRPDGSGWVVLVDPEGNEFCIELSITESNAV